MLGNRSLIEQIRRQAAAGSLSHAYLITGEKGMGKKTLAQLICLEIFCRQKKDGEPCGECPECKKVLNFCHPDVIYVKHEKPQLLSVDEIREQVCDTVGIRPYEGGRKVYVIPDADLMNPSAQNALLKSLEEPPEYVMMLLLCSDERMMLDTVRSRCVKMRLQPIPVPEVKNFLVETAGIDAAEADIAAGFAKGNPGRALEMAGDEDFREIYKEAVGLCRNIRSMDASKIAKIAQSYQNNTSALLLLELIENWYRDLLYYRTTGSTDGICFCGEKTAIKTQGAGIRADLVSKVIALTGDAAVKLRANCNRGNTLTVLFLKMREL